MPQTIQLPDGTLIEVSDDPQEQQQVREAIVRKWPQLGKRDRTWGEAATDFGAGLASGAGSLAALPGQLYGLATGDMDNASTRAGKAIKEAAEGMESEGLKTRKGQRRVAIENATREGGQTGAFMAALGETVSDPALMLNFVAEQLPNLLPGLGAAKVASLATKGAATLGTKTAAAIGAGAAQQGADVGASTYDRVVAELKKQGATDEQAAEGAINLARASGASAAAVSVLANRYLPGGSAVEAILAGGKLGAGRLASAAKGALKEPLSEVAEEVGGQFGANLAMREVNPEQDLREGLGETGGMAAAGGIGLGGIAGALGANPAQPGAADGRGENLEALQHLKDLELAARADAKRAADRAFADPNAQMEIREALPENYKGEPLRYTVTDEAAAPAPGRPKADPNQLDLFKRNRKPAVGGSWAGSAPTVTEPQSTRNATEPQSSAAAEPVPEPTLRSQRLAAQAAPPVEPSMGPLDIDKPLEPADLVGLTDSKQANEWLNQNVIGKTARQVSDMIAAKPGMAKGRTKIAIALRELTATVPPAPAQAQPPAGQAQPPAGQAQPPADQAQPPADQAQPPAVAPPSVDATIAALEGAKTDEEYQQGLRALAVLNRDTTLSEEEQSRVADYVVESSKSPAFKRDYAAAQYQLRRERSANLERPDDASPATQTPDLTAAVDRGDTKRALESIAQDPQATDLQRAVAQRLLRMPSLPKIERMEGVVPDSGAYIAGQYDSITDTVRVLVPDAHTVLHETVHSAAHRLIQEVLNGNADHPAVERLFKLYDHVMQVAPHLAEEYGMHNLSEFASEAMSNPKFQDQLRNIPYTVKQSVFTAFARTIMQLLGFADTPPNTALAEAFLTVDKLMVGGRLLQESEPGKRTAGGNDVPLLERIVATSELMRGQSGLIQRAYARAAEVFDTAHGITAATRLRAYVTDNMAAPAKFFDSVWGGKITSSLGQTNPMLALRDVQDFNKRAEAILISGGIAIDPTTNTTKAVEVVGVPSMTAIWDAVKSYGRANNMAFDEAYATLSKMFEANRADAIRTYNKSVTDPKLRIRLSPLSKKDRRPIDQQIDDMLRLFKGDVQAQKIHGMLKDSREHFIDFMESTGRITAAQATEWKASAEYVPFDRMRDLKPDDFVASNRGARGVAVFRNRPDLVGSTTREVGNVFDNHMGLILYMAQEGAKAKATRHALYTMAALGMATRHKTKPVDGEANAVQVYERGQPIWFATRDPLFALAFRSDAAQQAPWIQAMQGATRVLRSTITLMPPFIVSQVTQDITRAMISSGVERPWALPRQIVTNFFRFAWSDLTGKRHPDVARLADRGIAGGYDLDLRDPAASALRELGYRTRSPIAKLARAADGILRASDLAVRAAIYDQTKAETGDQALALQRGREIINFRRKGASSFIGFLTSTIPFVNAYMQSMDLLYRNTMGVDNSMGISRNAARAKLMTQLMALSAFSFVYALAMSDDDEYNSMDLRERNKHFLIPSLDVKIPVPPEWAAIAKVPAEMFVEYTRKQGTPDEVYAMDALKAVLGAVYEAVGAPHPIPAALRPAVEAVFNMSLFTGEALEGSYQQTLDPSERTTYRTSEFSKAIASAAAELGFQVSPIKMDHLIQGYTATAGTTMLAMTDAILNPDRMDRPIYKTFMASTFIYDPIGARQEREFYDFAEKVMPKAKTLNDMLLRDPEKAEIYAQKHAVDLEASTAVGAIIQQLGDMRKYEKYLRSNQAAADGMTQEERRSALDTLRTERAELTKYVREIRAEYESTKSAKP